MTHNGTPVDRGEAKPCRPALVSVGVPLPLLLCLAAFRTPEDPHALSEWELLTHPAVWGTPGTPWTTAPMWPGVTGGDTLSGPYWIEPHTPASPVELQFWSVPTDASPTDAATILSPWFLDPDKPVVTPPKPDPRQPKPTEPAPWTNLERIGDRRPVVAFTHFTSPREEVRVARVSGARWFLWNGEPFIADRDRHGFEGVPVLVRSGANRVFVAADGQPFEFVLHEPRSTLYVDRFDIVWPGGADMLGDEILLNEFNASTGTVRCLCTHYGHVSGWSTTCAPRLTDWRDTGYFAPLCMYRSATYYSGFSEDECRVSPDVDHGCEYNAISVYTNDGSPAERLLLRRGSAWESRRPNNINSVARAARDEDNTVADQFRSDAVHVYASGQREVVTLARARVLQQAAWYLRGEVPLVVSDVDAQTARGAERGLLKWELEKGQVVLHGNATTNVAWPVDPPKGIAWRVVEGQVEFDGRAYEGDDLAGWMLEAAPNPAGLAICFDTGPAGARLALLLATTWTGPRSRFAIFRVDPTKPCGWVRLDEPEAR